jgi:exosortase D (VPLPA-CTERM-specific)
VVLLALTAWLYASILDRLFHQWASDQDTSHGFFVPIFALLVLWQDRKRLMQVKRAPSWSGLAAIVVALAMLLLGIWGAELFFSRTSLLVLLAGLIVLFQGWAMFRAVLFPWACLFLMIPFPNLVMQKITFPLQMLAAKVSSGLLPVCGVPVLREGNVINLPAMPLEVAQACSGIRSLLSLITLAIIYGYLMDKRIWVRVVLAISAVPIAIAANAFRIFSTGLVVQYWDPEKGQGFYHLFSGWLIFVVSLIMLFTLHHIINAIWQKEPSAAVESSMVVPRAVNAPMNGASLRFALAASLMLATAVVLQAHSRNEVYPPRAPLSSLPSEISGYTGRDQTLNQETRDILGHPEYVYRDYYVADTPQLWVNLFIAYFPSQKTGETPHSPQHCLPGSGWVPTSREIISLRAPDGSSFPANRYVVAKGEDRQIVLYWFQAHGRAVASEYWTKYYLIADSIRMNRSDGALVRLMGPMLPGETSVAAEARVMKLGNQLLPVLDGYIPR